MSFNFPWTNRKNNQDYVLAEDVNALAGGIRMAGSHAENVLAAHKQSADHDVRYYTKQQSCDRFANALIGSTIGSTIALTDIQPGATEARELTIYGKTVETGTGDKSPDNPYTLTGVGESGTVPIVVSDGTNSQTVNVPVSAPLYSLPNGVRDEVDVTGGKIVRRISRSVLDGDSNIVWAGATDIDCEFTIKPVPPETTEPGITSVNFYCDKIRVYFFANVMRVASTPDGFYFVKIPNAWTGITVEDTGVERRSKIKAWLSANPITVIYELKEPVIESIPPIDIPLYYPDCTITTTDEVEPELHVAYNRDLNATLQALQDAIETITGG